MIIIFSKNKWNVLHAKKDLSTQLTDINGETDTVRGRINSWAGRGITFSYFHTLSMAESYGFKSETISSFHGTIWKHCALHHTMKTMKM